MTKVDRLLIEAKRISELSEVNLCLTTVAPEGDFWISKAHLWAGCRISCPHYPVGLTRHIDETVAHLHHLADQYPNKNDVTILVDDIPRHSER